MEVQTLSGKVALVTGAGRGIGRAIALGYARAGARVSCGARTTSEIDATVAEIESTGGDAVAVPVDVRDLESVSRLVETTVDRFGGIDILVLNAGISLDRSTVEESDPMVWRETLDTNLVGAYYCAREAVPHLKKSASGKIITIGSGLGHRGQSQSSAYACSKAGLWMLTRVLAQELWEDNVSVNELIPGPVDTAMSAGPSGPPPGSIWQSEWFKTADEVLPLALFLASQPAKGPTAQSYSLMRRDT
jgi:3-oxoacyl-[acyl-carrier protein] reductase